jgi:hypothetical protein
MTGNGREVSRTGREDTGERSAIDGYSVSLRGTFSMRETCLES